MTFDLGKSTITLRLANSYKTHTTSLVPSTTCTSDLLRKVKYISHWLRTQRRTQSWTCAWGVRGQSAREWVLKDLGRGRKDRAKEWEGQVERGEGEAGSGQIWPVGEQTSVNHWRLCVCILGLDPRKEGQRVDLRPQRSSESSEKEGKVELLREIAIKWWIRSEQ